MNLSIKPLSFYTSLGVLIRYITHTGVNNFSPMNANFGIIYKANVLTNEEIVHRSETLVKDFIDQFHD